MIIRIAYVLLTITLFSSQHVFRLYQLISTRFTSIRHSTTSRLSLPRIWHNVQVFVQSTDALPPHAILGSPTFGAEFLIVGLLRVFSRSSGVIRSFSKIWIRLESRGIRLLVKRTKGRFGFLSSSSQRSIPLVTFGALPREWWFNENRFPAVLILLRQARNTSAAIWIPPFKARYLNLFLAGHYRDLTLHIIYSMHYS